MAAGPRPAPVDFAPIEVLFLCTGNICRSPAAEALLRHRLAAAGVDATIRSAGVLGGGQRASSHGVAVLSERGIDLSAHRSQPITGELLRRADLILAMAREHVREAVVEAPEVWPRTFTLKEIVRRGRHIGARRPGQTLEQWLSYVHEERTTRELMGMSSEDDVSDPIGQPRHAYERMVADLDRLIEEVVWLVWGAESRGEWAS